MLMVWSWLSPPLRAPFRVRTHSVAGEAVYGLVLPENTAMPGVDMEL